MTRIYVSKSTRCRFEFGKKRRGEPLSAYVLLTGITIVTLGELSERAGQSRERSQARLQCRGQQRSRNTFAGDIGACD